MKRSYLLVCASLLSGISFAQVNGFAKVANISGTTLTVSNVNESYDTFEIGENIIIMQMQDDVIGSNLDNNASFGSLDDIGSAGLYEVVEINSVVESGSTPTQIILETTLTNTYSTSTNSSVQIFTFPDLGAGGDYTTSGTMTTIPWDGDIGGVLAFEVAGRLTLAHDIIANARGFRGGSADQYTSGSCDVNTYRYSSTASGTDQYATKGEGIYKITDDAYRDARAKILNGGGGANEHNGGGGGGGNYTAGGEGGPGWNCGSNSAGGQGGIELGSETSASRIFMGGGGGGGEGNNSQATNGGNGGGIILIKAGQIQTPTTCSGLTISSNGDPVVKAGQDGAGGGGAGGTVLIDCPSFNIGSSCTLEVQANGGDGGNVDHWDTHGGGGGGGQGAVIFSSAFPVDVTVSTNNGNGGCNNNSDPCNSNASNGSGSNGSGMMGSASGPLPIELLSFQVIPIHEKAQITWSTATELNNDFFTVERSKEGVNWHIVDIVNGAGDSHSTLFYQTVDEQPILGTSYYRLKQTDFNGASTYSDIQSVFFSVGQAEITVHPNPATNLVTVSGNIPLNKGAIKMHNGVGQILPIDIRYSGQNASIDVSQLHPGPYFIRIELENEIIKRKLIVE